MNDRFNNQEQLGDINVGGKLEVADEQYGKCEVVEEDSKLEVVDEENNNSKTDNVKPTKKKKPASETKEETPNVGNVRTGGNADTVISENNNNKRNKTKKCLKAMLIGLVLILIGFACIDLNPVWPTLLFGLSGEILFIFSLAMLIKTRLKK